MPKNIFFIVNVDWFFLSHRLPLAVKMKDSGYDVYILTKNSGRRTEIESYGLKFIDVDFQRSGKNPFKELSVIFKIYRNLMRFKPSIVHNVTIKPALYSTIAWKLYGNKKIKNINAISGLGYNFIGGRDGIVQRVLKKLMNFAFSKDVNFIFQNPDDLQVYKQLGYLEKNRYKLIKGAGVDSNEFQVAEPVLKDRLHVVLTARMLKDKGILEFIDAARILEDKWKDGALFRLIGDLDHENPAGIKEEELKNLEVDNYIVWEGYRSDIMSILKDSDIVCLPSYREGLPKSLIEAMAIGRPIVSTDVPGCRECVDENFNGFLVKAKDSKALSEKIDTLLGSETMRLKMGANSRSKMVNELSLDKVLKDTCEFYDEILA